MILTVSASILCFSEAVVLFQLPKEHCSASSPSTCVRAHQHHQTNASEPAAAVAGSNDIEHPFLLCRLTVQAQLCGDRT